jgi:cyclopropane fatty-acyl-phospholipid synthase-like methyltransferase
VSHLTLADFEARYRAEGDPWSYETSAYERAKYDATLEACGPGPFREALELGSSIGVLSERLAPRCERLTTIDGAATAVALARRRLGPESQVEVLLGAIPDAIPARSYDLVLASEILYYLEAPVLTATLERLRELSAPEARLVAVHWRPEGPERPASATEVHRRLHAQQWLAPIGSASTDDYLLDTFSVR